jgi:plastocyanin
MQRLIVRRRLVRLLLPVVVVAVSILTPQTAVAGQGPRRMLHQVTVPMDDRFTPFALTIHVGDSVRWVNQDTDDHTVVTDNAFTTADHRGVDHLLPGTDSTPGGGMFTLEFQRPGVFVYYCRFHAVLDASNQPVAPGPRGGIQDPRTRNFGTPMMGVITVLPERGDD